MIIRPDDNTTIDTDRDLGPEERHILQKLLCYVHFVGSIEEFREKKEKAFRTGWDNSGPVRESPLMAGIGNYLERELAKKLK